MEFRKEVTREHRLNEPHSSAAGCLSEAQSRGETPKIELPAEASGGDVFMLRMSSKAEPHGSLGKRELRTGMRH